MTDDPRITDTTEAVQGPNDLLAAEIAGALVEAGLITDGRKAALLAKLKSGGVRRDDWNLWVDMATAPDATDEEAHDE